MSRKNMLTGLAGEPTAAAADPAPAAAGTPVAHLGKMLGAIRDRSERAQEIEKALAAGDRVVEVDPGLIDPSPIADRLPCPAEAERSLRESIAEHGQRVPVLLRRAATGGGRFVTVYGHRRVAAATALGRKARAIIVEMGDEEAFVAQGVENAERKDLSFIERALFARRLADAGVSARSVAAALGTARPNIVTMVTLCRRLPEGLIAAIGPSPGLGRRRWEELDARLAAQGANAAKLWRKAAAAPGFEALDPEARFAAIIDALAARAPAPQTSSAAYRDERGATFCVIEKSRAGEVRLKLKRGDASFRADGAAFGDWLATHMEKLHAAWRRGE